MENTASELPREPACETGGSGRPEPGTLEPSVEAIRALLPGYEVVGLAGRGGMGAVYRARHRALDRDVAIKLLPAPVAGTGESDVPLERFRQEARTLAQLNHPGIVAVFDSGRTADGRSFFVMEYVDGMDLAQTIRTAGRLPPDRVLSVMGQLCDALEYAHARGVVHRDIKPGNILVGCDGRIRVADFGLARVEGLAVERALTRSNVGLGTADYAAPELLGPPGDPPDGRADIYSVGVVLYQLLTGELPRGLFKMPSQKVLGLDPRFDAIVCRAMEAAPADRYARVQELRADLAAIRAGEIAVTLPVTEERGGASAPASSSGSRTGRVWVRPLLAWGGVALLVGVALMATRPKPPEPTGAREVAAVPAEGAAAGDRLKDWLPVVDPEAGWQSLLDGLPPRPPGVTAEWRRIAGELRTTLATVKGHQTLEFPEANLPPNYDIRVRLTRHDGQGAVMVAFRHGDGAAAVMVDSFTGVQRYYEAMVATVRGDLTGTIGRKDGMFLKVGRRHEIVVRVRDDHVIGEVDGQEWVRWRGDWRQVGQWDAWFFPAQLAGRPIFGIGVCCSDMTFHSIDWRAAAD